MIQIHSLHPPKPPPQPVLQPQPSCLSLPPQQQLSNTSMMIISQQHPLLPPLLQLFPKNIMSFLLLDIL